MIKIKKTKLNALGGGFVDYYVFGFLVYTKIIFKDEDWK